jgi:uncharacterized membrane protein
MFRRPVTGLFVAGAIALAASTAGSAQLSLLGMHSPLSGTSHPAAANPAPPKCPANLVAGTIGGQAKCLAPGQQCQQAHAADYTHYGFTCGKVGNRFQLSKTGGAKPAPAKPAPAKPTPAKPAPAHH